MKQIYHFDSLHDASPKYLAIISNYHLFTKVLHPPPAKVVTNKKTVFSLKNKLFKVVIECPHIFTGSSFININREIFVYKNIHESNFLVKKFVGAWYPWKYRNTEIFVTVNNIAIVYILYLQAQHRPLATKKATVKLVNDARVTCNLQQVLKRKIEKEAPITRFSPEVSQQIHLCILHLVVHSQLKLAWNKHRVLNKKITFVY